MSINEKSIQYIKIDNEDYHFNAVTVGNKSAAEIGELVTSISGSSTDSQYPSAKCIYEMIYGPTS